MRLKNNILFHQTLLSGLRLGSMLLLNVSTISIVKNEIIANILQILDLHYICNSLLYIKKFQLSSGVSYIIYIINIKYKCTMSHHHIPN